jgi:ADP-ribosylglycohydrolase
MNFKQRIINGLYGMAVADAVGNQFEFKKNIKPKDIIKYANDTNVLVISDDTQMALFGFEAIFQADSLSITDLEESFTDSYIDWYFTQQEPYDPEEPVIDSCIDWHFTQQEPCDSSKLDSYQQKSLSSFRNMWSVQAPGDTCLTALEMLDRYVDVENDSMGCGSVMRLLPLVFLYGEKSLSETIAIAQMTGAITHKHIANDLAIAEYISHACEIVAGKHPVNPYPNIDNISALGSGWIAPECVEMAIWCYHTATTFDELLQLSIAHDGDSDSVAAVAGSLWGLAGKDIPDKYVEKLDALDAIIHIVEQV